MIFQGIFYNFNYLKDGCMILTFRDAGTKVGQRGGGGGNADGKGNFGLMNYSYL